jgi:hypothetical protein
MPLFDEQESGRKLGAAPKLTELEKKRVRLMESLLEIAKEQKSLQSEMRGLERELKKELQLVEEHWVPDDRDLSLADVEAWCRSAFYNMAHSMPQNPHCYFARKKVRRPEMYERVVRYILAHGYPQRYSTRTYTCLDVRMNDGVWFLWPMTDDPSDSEVLNLKPCSMKPEKEERA